MNLGCDTDILSLAAANKGVLLSPLPQQSAGASTHTETPEHGIERTDHLRSWPTGEGARVFTPHMCQAHVKGLPTGVVIFQAPLTCRVHGQSRILQPKGRSHKALELASGSRAGGHLHGKGIQEQQPYLLHPLNLTFCFEK